MAKPESVFIYIGTYVDEAATRDDSRQSKVVVRRLRLLLAAQI
jgi:hypothetical protein